MSRHRVDRLLRAAAAHQLAHVVLRRHVTLKSATGTSSPPTLGLDANAKIPRVMNCSVQRDIGYSTIVDVTPDRSDAICVAALI
jgi:hypothetical protein